MISPISPIIAMTLNLRTTSRLTEIQNFLDICDKSKIKITLLVDSTEQREEILQFWKEAILTGHDVQPLLSSPASVKKSKETLENFLKPLNSNYQVITCRVEHAADQSYKDIYQALVSEGIYCDSSVDGTFPFRYSTHQPYFANPYAPQLRAPASEKEIVQIPVFNTSLKSYLKKQAKKRGVAQKNAFLSKGLRKLSKYYCKFAYLRKMINPIIPQKFLYCICDYEPEELVKHHYFVLENDLSDLDTLKDSATFITLSQMAEMAHQELSATLRKDTTEEAEFQVEGSYQAVMGTDRNLAQSAYLQNLIPWDCESVLDFGCGSGYWTDRIAKLYPWISKIIGIDFGMDFIKKANDLYQNERISFVQGNFEELPFPDKSFDCVYADSTLEHAFDINRALQEIYRVLKDNGSLIAIIPSDARNPDWSNSCHIWKTIPEETYLRLEDNGFMNIEIEEVDSYKTFSMAPYPPSHSQIMFIRAWKQSRLARVKHAAQWVSQTDLSKLSSTIEKSNPVALLKELLKREGYSFTQKRNTLEVVIENKDYSLETIGL